jgi:uncharacterized protein
LSSFHPEHGIIVASPYEQFDGNRFYEPKYVRAYRARMLKMIQLGQPGFGLRFDENPTKISIEFCDLNQALIKYTLQENISVTVKLEVDETGCVTQSTTISSTSSEMSHIQYTLDLGISVNRASYGQLTEGGPIPIPPLENILRILDHGRQYAIVNRHLGAHLEGNLLIDGVAVDLVNISNETFTGTPVSVSFSDAIRLPASESKSFIATFRLIPDVTIRESLEMTYPNQVSKPPSSHNWAKLENDAVFIIRRNLEYILGNCTIPVSATEVALITDHVALPLGWNRDN